MKSMVYGTPVTSEDLILRVHGATESLTRQLHLLEHVCEAHHRRCNRLYNDVEVHSLNPQNPPLGYARATDYNLSGKLILRGVSMGK